MATKAAEKHYFGREKEPIDLEVARAEGSLLYDESGKEYIDFVSGWCVGNLGWGIKEIESAIRENERPTYVATHFKYKPWTDLAELLAGMAPGNLTTTFRATGGSEAVDGAMQMAMLHTGRSKFLSVEGSFHGNTLGALSIGASAKRKKLQNLLPGCHKLELPLDRKAVEKAEELLKKKDIAAFIMEPIIMNLGVIIPGQEFIDSMRSLCTRYGTLLVFDEVACGFGRTGKLFASEHYNVVPDMLCLAKAVSGGYAGMGAIMTTDEIADTVKGELSLYSTYGWHPVSVDAAIAYLRYWNKNKSQLLANAAEISSLFSEKLNNMNFRKEAEVRIKGLAIAVEVSDADYAEELRKKCLRNGLLITTEEESLMFFPPLTIDKETAGKGLSILEDSLT